MKSIKKECQTMCLVLFCLLVCFCASQKQSIRTMMPMAAKNIVLDAGHGGWDPGKIGKRGENEQALNLAITQKLQQYLEQGGANVYLTRADSNALGQSKKEDMRQRKEITNTSQADILISIHQNAFPTSSPKGAQVFYHKQSAEGKELAQYIQNSLKQRTDTNNKREAKANTDYYILRTTEIPAALVECGFLSNPEEEQKLNDTEYQDKVAWGIYCGILDYFAAKEGADGLQADKKQI